MIIIKDITRPALMRLGQLRSGNFLLVVVTEMNTYIVMEYFCYDFECQWLFFWLARLPLENICKVEQEALTGLVRYDWSTEQGGACVESSFKKGATKYCQQ